MNFDANLTSAETSHHTGASETLVDYDASLQRLGGDKELFDEFVQILLTDSPKLVSDLATAVESGDCRAVHQAAHALKGLMSNFGAKPCCALALEFEIAGREQNIASMKGQFPKLKQLYEKLCDELRAC
jgi:HPt (histidine-containing phosphotransfer) domain-containing protein